MVFKLLDINVDTIIYRYGQIDAFSQGKHPSLSLREIWVKTIYGSLQLPPFMDYR
jgi:hypothetical protein